MERSDEGGGVRVGFVGLGDQGYPMAQRLLAGGFDLAVHARRPGVINDLVTLGATPCGGVAELAAVSDVLAVCVGDDGPHGSGQTLKLVNNLVFTAEVAITRDTLRLVADLGLDAASSMQSDHHVHGLQPLHRDVRRRWAASMPSPAQHGPRSGRRAAGQGRSRSHTR